MEFEIMSVVIEANALLVDPRKRNPAKNARAPQLMDTQVTIVAYARFSSANQLETSIDRQFDIIDARAEKFLGRKVDLRFKDEAISGTTHSRKGIDALIKYCQKNSGTIVFFETLDRASRTVPAFYSIIGRLRECGTRIFDRDGEKKDYELFLKALGAADDLERLSKRNRFARLVAVADDASWLPMVPFGYTKPATGRVAIVPEQAEIVLEIFEKFARKAKPNAIAKDLNSRGLTNAAGRRFHKEHIRDCLRNPMYLGLLIQYFAQDEASDDALRPRLRSKAENVDIVLKDGVYRVIVRLPELRIVPDELWYAARDLDVPGNNRGRLKEGRSDFILSGKFKCPTCGSNMQTCGHVAHDRLLGCSNARNSGLCVSQGYYSMRQLEQLAVGGLLGVLRGDGELFKAAAEQAYQRRVVQSERDLQLMKARIEALDAQIERGVAASFDDARLNERHGRMLTEKEDELLDLKASRHELERAVVMKPPSPDFLSFAETVQKEVLDWSPFVPTNADEEALLETIRGHIRSISVVHADQSSVLRCEYDLSDSVAVGKEELIVVREIPFNRKASRAVADDALDTPEGKRGPLLALPPLAELCELEGVGEALSNYHERDHYPLLQATFAYLFMGVPIRGAERHFGVNDVKIETFFYRLTQLGAAGRLVDFLATKNPKRKVCDYRLKFFMGARCRTFPGHCLRQGSQLLSLPHCDKFSSHSHDLTDEEWSAIRPLFPKPRKVRVSLNALFHALREDRLTTDVAGKSTGLNAMRWAHQLRERGLLQKMVDTLLSMQNAPNT